VLQGFALGQTNQHQRCDRRIEEAVEADDRRRSDEEKEGDAERQASEPHGRGPGSGAPEPSELPRTLVGCLGGSR
jgi:hypothetical protein